MEFTIKTVTVIEVDFADAWAICEEWYRENGVAGWDDADDEGHIIAKAIQGEWTGRGHSICTREDVCQEHQGAFDAICKVAGVDPSTANIIIEGW